MKFTKEIKHKWLAALKSGDYIQGKGFLKVQEDSVENVSGKIEHCCIGVLGEVCNFLNNKDENTDTKEETSPYKFLKNNLDSIIVMNLFEKNDEEEYWKNNPPQDYSNVIPLIEKLKTYDK